MLWIYRIIKKLLKNQEDIMSGLTDLTSQVQASGAVLASIQAQIVQLQAGITALQSGQGDSDSQVGAQAQALATINTGLQGVSTTITGIVSSLPTGGTT
jgi:peptidoglycan hydrolase CwlO-like protein